METEAVRTRSVILLLALYLGRLIVFDPASPVIDGEVEGGGTTTGWCCVAGSRRKRRRRSDG